MLRGLYGGESIIVHRDILTMKVPFRPHAQTPRNRSLSARGAWSPSAPRHKNPGDWNNLGACLRILGRWDSMVKMGRKSLGHPTSIRNSASQQPFWTTSIF